MASAQATVGTPLSQFSIDKIPRTEFWWWDLERGPLWVHLALCSAFTRDLLFLVTVLERVERKELCCHLAILQNYGGAHTHAHWMSILLLCHVLGQELWYLKWRASRWSAYTGPSDCCFFLSIPRNHLLFGDQAVVGATTDMKSRSTGAMWPACVTFHSHLWS